MNNKKLFKWFSMLLLMMVAGISDAAAQSLGLADFSIKAGETKEVAITLTSESDVYGIQTDIVLSEGLSLDGFQTISGLELNANDVNGAMRVSLLSLQGASIAAGDVITLKVKAASDFQRGTVSLTNSRITTDTKGTEVKAQDVTTNVTLLNYYSAIFKTNYGWAEAWAYVWSGEGQNEVLGKFPGKKLSYNERYSQYELGFDAETAPEKIIFSNGLEGDALQQTEDLDFVNQKTYEYNKPEDPWVDIVINGNMEGESNECFYVTEQFVGGPYLAKITEGIGKEGSKAVMVQSEDEEAMGNHKIQNWNAQFFLRLPYQIPAGTPYRVSFDYKADKPGAFETQSHTEPGGYIHWQCIPNGSFTTSWQTYEAVGTINETMSPNNNMQTIAFNLAQNGEATQFVFDNVVFEIPQSVLNTLKPNPATNARPYPVPVEINSLAIVGDFIGGEATDTDPEPWWNPANGWQMTQDAEKPGTWTLTKEFTAEAKEYEYKATANGKWGDYELPDDGNFKYKFDTAGDYVLTFKANTRIHALSLDVEEAGMQDFTATFTTNADWGNVYAYTWTDATEATAKVEQLGAWPGTKLVKNAETGVYDVKIRAKEAPAMIIFNNGNSGEGNQTADLAFENGKAYEYTVEAGAETALKEAPEGWTLAVNNGNLAGDDASSYIMKEYPEGVIKDATIEAGAGTNGSRGIVVKAGDDTENESYAAWDSQFWIKLNEAVPAGTKIHVEFDYKASQAAKATTQAHYTPGAFQYWACIGDVNFTTEWQTFSTDIEVSDAMAGTTTNDGVTTVGPGLLTIAFNLQEEKSATNYYFDNFGIWYQKPAVISDWTDIMVNGNMEGESAECFYVTEQGIGGPFLANFTEGIGKDDSKAVKVESYYDPKENWDSQFFIRLPYQVPAGTPYRVSFDYKADKAGDFDTQCHAEPGQYIHYICIGTGSFTTEWQTYEKEGTIPAECDGSPNNGFLKIFQTIAFNLGANKVATQFVFDNVKFEVPTDALPTLTLNPAQNPVPYTKPEYNSMAIVGDFLGLEAAEGEADPNWDPANGWQMTQDAENPAVWTFIKDEFTAEAKTYEYKATANGKWGDYELPAEGNADYNFDTPNLGAGKYKLTFTVDTRKHSINLDVEKLDVTTYTATFTTDAEWEEVYAYAWSGTEPNVTKFLGDWPGTKLEKNAETGVYTVSIVSTDAPEMIIFNNGNSGEGNQTSDLEFVNGAAYEYKKPTGEEAPIILAPEGWTLATTNGNLAEDDASSYLMKEYPSSDIVPASIVAGAGTDGSRGILVKAGDDTANEGAQDWDSQFWIVLNEELPSGSKLHVEFDYKASEAATANTQSHGEPGAYLHWAAIGDVNFTTEWQHFSNDITVDDAMAKGDNGNGSGTGMKTIAFNLAVNRNAVNYQFDNFGVWYQKPVEIETMAIVGDFLGLDATGATNDPNWDPANGWQMEKDAENPAIWTLTKPFTAEAKTYEYKATANGKWGDYELPAEGNQNFVFGTEEYPAGDYNLTFTADTEKNTLDLVVEKASIKTFTATFTTNAPWSKVYAYAWTTTDEGDQGTTTEYLGAWPGIELTAGADDVYTVTIKGEEAPAMIIFNNGQGGEGNQTEDLAFEDGKAYEYVFTPTFDFENNNGQWTAETSLTEANPITMDGVILTGISAVKIKSNSLNIGKGSFKLTAPEGKNIVKVEFKAMGTSEVFLESTPGEITQTMVKLNAAEEPIYSIMTWTGQATEVTFSCSSRGRNIGYINVVLEDAAPAPIAGDLNGDGVIDGFDIVAMVQLIMEQGYKLEADLYPATAPDNVIDGFDLVALVDLIMAQPAPSHSPAMSALAEKPLTLTENNAGVKTLGIDAYEQFILTQMMVELSDGMTLTGVTTDNRHTVAYRQLDDNKYMVLCYSDENAAFDSNANALTFHYTGNGEMKVNNALLISADKQGYRGTDVTSGSTTGISTIISNGQPFDVYTADGRLVKRGVTSTKGLSKGMYIINEQKIVVK